MAFGTVSVEELLGRCNEVYKANHKYIAQLEESMAELGYVPELEADDGGVEMPDEDDLLENSISLQNLGLSDVCLATLASQDTAVISSANIMSLGDNQSYGKTLQYKPSKDILDGLDTCGNAAEPMIEYSKADYDDLPSYMRSLASWEEKVDQARENRGMVKMMHTAGTKSYAKRRAEYKAKHGKEMDQIELFIDCHTKNTDIIAELNNKKNAIPEEERSRESLDQIYEAVVGPGSDDRVNGYGMGVTKSLLRGTARSNSSTQVLELEKTIDSLKASLEAQAAAHTRALEEQTMSHARAIKEQTRAQEKLYTSLEDLKSMFFLMAGKIQTGSK